MRGTALGRQLRRASASTPLHRGRNRLTCQALRPFTTTPRALLAYHSNDAENHSQGYYVSDDDSRSLDLFSTSEEDFDDAHAPSQDLSTGPESDIPNNPNIPNIPNDPNDPRHNHKLPLLSRIRVVPESPSYFSAQPNFTDEYLRVEALYLKWKALPRAARPLEMLWRSFDEVKASVGNEPILPTRYRRLISMLKDLNAIEPVLMPAEVRDLIDRHKRAHQPSLEKPKIFDVDEWGRSLGVGKRKTATAKAYLVMGEGEVLVNGKPLTDVFARIHDRESALWSLKIADRMDKYNVFAILGGGGVTGQAEAMTLAVARALLVHEPALEARLIKAGCLFRDPRVVERKKTGHLKARKMPAWVKR